MTFIDIIRSPDCITVETDGGRHNLTSDTGSSWGFEEIEVGLQVTGSALAINVRGPRSALHRLHLRWKGTLPPDVKILGDHWERGYGDLEWRGAVAERVLPWYFLTYDGKATHGYGVLTAPRSLCFWQVDSAGVSLWLDLRNGASGVLLGDRTLEAATVTSRHGADTESPYGAASAFCRLLCRNPKQLTAPVYGGNNWYYAYGNSSSDAILKDSALIAGLSPVGGNRPFMVIDDGWQVSGPVCGGGPWRYSNRDFPDMSRLAREMKAQDVRPGIWVRPLLSGERLPGPWFLPGGRGESGNSILDPSVPEALEHIAREVAVLREWGYELIKHDFTTYDLLGLWGFALGSRVTPGNWSFSDRGRTTAEIVLALYGTLQEAAGDALVIGCNTIGHLGAGLFDMQRTGDDTSGRDWERTRKMGINALAFRMPQHGAFFAADADCVGLTKEVPWEQNSQWLDLLAASGTPLFVSIDPAALGREQREAVTLAFAIASREQPYAEPLDWLETTCPARWRIGGKERTYAWYPSEGVNPFCG